MPTPQTTAARPCHPRRIAVVTGTRAEYGLLTSSLEAIADHPRLSLQLVVTGMHLLPRFGRTISEIVADGWKIAAKIPMQRGDDHPLDQADGLARGVRGMSRFFSRSQPDIVLVLGDRIEALAGALAAVMTGCVVAHIHGGDVAPGDFDDSLRHAITKLAHVHLAATRDAARRIVRMGERRECVFVVGAPGQDRLEAILREHGGPVPLRTRARQAVVLQHPCGRSAADEQRVMKHILAAVRAEGLGAWIGYPNSDRGHSGVIDAIDAVPAAGRNGHIQVVRSIPRDEFLHKLMTARVLIGNSSAGIIEAPGAGTPSVNVGERQAGRLRGGPSVIDCEESYASIRAALRRALRARLPHKSASVYGRGNAGGKIAEILADIPLNARLRRKQIAY